MNKFSQRLHECREEKGITRKELADNISVSVRLVSYWENGERECDFDMLIKIANFLGESIDYLLGRTDF